MPVIDEEDQIVASSRLSNDLSKIIGWLRPEREEAAADRLTIEHPNDFWLAKPYRAQALRDVV